MTSERKIHVYRQNLHGHGEKQSEHDTPSAALLAASKGHRAEPRTQFGRAMWYVAFPLEGGRWDIWYV